MNAELAFRLTILAGTNLFLQPKHQVTKLEGQVVVMTTVSAEFFQATASALPCAFSAFEPPVSCTNGCSKSERLHQPIDSFIIHSFIRMFFNRMV